jgi:hypothetical protein
MGASYRTTRQVATAYPVAEALSLGSLCDRSPLLEASVSVPSSDGPVLCP